MLHLAELSPSETRALHPNRLSGAELGPLARSVLTEGPNGERGRMWFEKAFPVYTQTPSQLTDKAARATVIMNLGTTNRFIGGEFRTFDFLNALRGIRCPVLLLAGELDPICPMEAAEEIAAAVPAELLTIRRYAKCGHGAYRDVPAAFDEIRRFIGGGDDTLG